ncbi:MAG: hypothetical protein IPH93_06870 [Saprospiraceae bacterium]|nr:hypothetical protein [Saprospiraceae bacterium]
MKEKLFIPIHSLYLAHLLIVLSIWWFSLMIANRLTTDKTLLWLNDVMFIIAIIVIYGLQIHVLSKHHYPFLEWFTKGLVSKKINKPNGAYQFLPPDQINLLVSALKPVQITKGADWIEMKIKGKFWESPKYLSIENNSNELYYTISVSTKPDIFHFNSCFSLLNKAERILINKIVN